MFRTLTAFAVALALVAFAGAPATADEPRKRARKSSSKGKITCAKCDLGTADKPATRSSRSARRCTTSTRTSQQEVPQGNLHQPEGRDRRRHGEEGRRQDGRHRQPRSSSRSKPRRCTTTRDAAAPDSGGGRVPCGFSVTRGPTTAVGSREGFDARHPGQPARLLCRRQHGHREPGGGPRGVRHAALRLPRDRPQPAGRRALPQAGRRVRRRIDEVPAGGDGPLQRPRRRPGDPRGIGPTQPAGHRRHLPAGHQGPPRGGPVRHAKGTPSS